MKRAALLTLALLVATGITYAMFLLTTLANGSVKGNVMKSTTREPIPGATVQAFIGKENKGGIATDLDGNYSLTLPQATYRFEITALGYDKKIIENVKVEDGKVFTNNILLSETKKELSAIVIDGAKVVTDKADDSSSPKAITEDAVRSSDVITYSHAPAEHISPTSVTYSTATTTTLSTTTGVKATGSSSKTAKAPVAYKTESKSTTRTLSDGLTKESSAKDVSVVKGKSTRFDADKKTDTKAPVREPDTRAGQLTAGEWSDNRNWDYFDGVRKKSDWKGMEPMWGFDLSHRYYVKVTSGGKPQNDVKVVLKDKKDKIVYEARTDNNGNCYLFAGLFDKSSADGGTVEVATSGGTKSVSAGSAGNTRPISVDISRSTKISNKLDIMFMIDATGSMGDEINYLKEELSDVIRRVKAESEQMVDIRVSANVYRDKGDEYVVRSFPFTNDMSKVLTNLNAQHAGGGGDFEEAVEEGLDDGINKHDWSDDATARIMFLVLDAPPHNTYDNNAKIQKAVINAAKKGIRIIPVTSSGIDKNTEFLMRFLSIATGGTYVFLTDHSGIGNSHIEPTIGKYDVEYLNNLMVRLIKAYLTTES
ncbi:MAG: carboxypeptidase-like regulatory domain-containing protein [Sphingobacteriales bacterium JAD_PAG50586_3]|nr:MAG: carboxypeptidase-like regulatory domain-containing protein [Sphingobacteriales bacterium JAD_PAG50586_3]